MDRAEKAGLGVAAAGHIVLFAALSASLLSTPARIPPLSMTVSLVDAVALDAAAPPAPEPPAASVAPESGPPEDAAPPEASAEAAPDSAPPAKQPDAASPPKPAPVAKPQPKSAPPQPAKAATPPKPQPAAKTPANPSPAKGTGTQLAANTTTRRGAILGDNFLKGIVADRTPPAAKGQVAPAAAMSQQAAADIGSAIQRQVQPCAERQQLNAPGAERIKVRIRLNLNRDGSLAARPIVVGHTGVDDTNGRYVDRIDDLAIAAFVGCAPLRGLPADLYAVPRGWKVFSLTFKLP